MQSVLVTGANSGIGRASAVRLAEAGYRVYAAMRDTGKAEKLLALCKAAGCEVVPIALDVSDASSVNAATEQVIREAGQLDVLINNAFRMPPFEMLIEQSLDVIRKSFEVNLFAALRLSREATPHLEKSPGGSIVMINSSVMRRTRATFGAYKMAKHALLGMAYSLACELGPKGIRVNVLSPGFIVPTAAEINLDPEETAAVLGEAVQSVPMGRIGAPSEVAEAALFLVTSSYVNGQVVRVDGGWGAT